MKRFKIYTLGCKVNQYETEAVEELLEKEGYILDPDDEADVVLINTCTVTNESDRKSRQIIRRHKRKNPDCKVVVFGCYAQVAREEVAKIEGVDLVLGTKNRRDIPEHLTSLFEGAEQIIDVESHEPGEAFETLKIKEIEGRTRAYMKVQDGCNQYCSYCIIPYARGFIRSRDLEESVQEAERLAKNGFKEVVLTGIHIGSYGKDLEGDLGLIDLIEAIAGVEGIERVRLSSVEPMTITEDFLSRVEKLENFMPHFHLSLQSGAAKTLRAMNRKYTPEDYRETVERIRRVYPDAGITTDVIVGFPGETEEDFEESYAFVEEMAFSDLHVFPYSQRRNTPAAKRSDQVPGEIKKDRAARMIELGKAMRREFIGTIAGKSYPVLFEEEKDGLFFGYTPNYLRVGVASDENIQNALEYVTIVKENDDIILGHMGKE
ncbi:MAG: tRNA (N(6)-L-threonylcarbamoyladenosine(37)-C(2))-methylthiotransferase MtaB [Peptoniphilus sp.]|nr:tRNA (N(6)-L-threonylcarbamoyladenosine(37)-C(2))-methylthiotransferase MtaB [Peptoniphilus sp.]MDD7362751.1 tRNA (N(6)-L-threonylcarbamoyladenosine(37)-C(2))-methylthiotransferase MtaB [Bacillota bacterium]MDY6044555.1 tRNA (N(6)-L-threonylcarbamoyladenosine(37)-C(2))-methylthiotransferase MtaB [Peptoniphilus sp.]